MFTNYTLTLHVDRLVGGIPKHPAIIKRWQEAHLTPGRMAPSVDTPDKVETAPELDDAAAATEVLLGSQALDPEEVVAGIWTGFVTDSDDNLAIESRLVKAMFKESANIIRVLPEALVRGKAIPLRARVAERVFVRPKLILLMKDDKPVREPESAERPIHVMTAQGPRTALKRTDYVDEVTLVCQLEVLNDGVVPERILRLILDHASRNGLGTDRSQGNGTFEYKLEHDE